MNIYKSLYKIKTYKSPTCYDRAIAAKCFQKVRVLAKATGEYVKIVKKARCSYSPENYAVNLVKQLRAQAKKEISHFNPGNKYIERKLWGVKLSSEIYSPKYGSTYISELKNAMVEIRSKVHSMRVNARARWDYLKERPTGYYLKKYQDKIFKRDKTPTSDNKFTGIEIECLMPENVDLTPLMPYAKWINVGSDGSIQIESGFEGREIRVCLENSEIKTVIPGLMATLRSMGAFVNKSCGLHVHLDRRHDTRPDLSFHKLVRSLGLLYTVVPKSRRNNQYCKRNRYYDFDVARNASRYKAINASAYDKYKTLEVRLFGGTLEETKIMNWIETLWAIVDGIEVQRVPKNFDTARKYWNLSDGNITWLKERQTKFAELNALAPTAEFETEDSQTLIEERREAEREAQENEDCGGCGDPDCDDCVDSGLVDSSLLEAAA